MDKKLIILLLGRNGQIGWELERTLAALGQVIAPDSWQLDLEAPSDIRSWVEQVRPNLIVNAAAYTAVDKAEEDRATALAVNGTAMGILGEEAKKSGSLVIHYSTDYVFDGNKETPYAETDEPKPLNYYGETKLAGEQALRHSGARHIIFRTSWVYGWRGKNFLGAILAKAATKQRLAIVDDQFGAPTWSRMVAEATALVIAKRGIDLVDVQGIYHLTCRGQASWYEFARSILNCDADSRINRADIHPIPSNQYTALARRPRYSVLSNDKMENTFGFSLPPWEQALKIMLAQQPSVLAELYRENLETPK